MRNILLNLCFGGNFQCHLKLEHFMWLMSKNKILTKLKLQEKGWQGDLSCQFCSQQEDNAHLFFQCYFAKSIWFYMGNCQDISRQWCSMDDVIHYALTLNKTSRTAFLIVVSAVIWCIWKQRNELCFRNSIVHSCRSVILTMVSIIIYWTGPLLWRRYRLLPMTGYLRTRTTTTCRTAVAGCSTSR